MADIAITAAVAEIKVRWSSIVITVVFLKQLNEYYVIILYITGIPTASASQLKKFVLGRYVQMFK